VPFYGLAVREGHSRVKSTKSRAGKSAERPWFGAQRT
jgi:hypothetical protein